MPNEAFRESPHYIHCSRPQANLRWTPSEARWPKSMFEYLVYLIYRAGFSLIGLLPLRTAFALGNTLGFCAWLLLGEYRRLGFHNADIAFGDEKSPREKRRLVRRHCQRLGANLLSSLKLSSMPLEEACANIQVENVDVAHRELGSGRPVVLILSHIANWQLLALKLPTVIGYVRNSTVYQPLKNRYIDKHVRALRGRAGVETFDRNEGFQKAIELLRGGGAIGILSDQHAGDQGLWVPFFGRLASTTPLPALLAKRTNAALIAVAFYTDGPARWRILFEPPLETKQEPVEAITAKTNDIISEQIRRAPEDWFWVHNRWKTPRPNFLLGRYKRGIYVPPQTSLQPFRILIRASNWLGDSIMSIPAVRAIKRGRPDAHVTIVGPAKMAPVWKLISEVDEFISISRKSLFATVRTIRRQRQFDAAVLFPNSLRVALEARCSNIPLRVGYRGHWRAWLLNQIVRKRGKSTPFEHESLHYLRIAENLGADVGIAEASASEKTSSVQRLALSEAQRSRTGPTLNVQFTTSHQPSSINHQPLLGLCPGAEYGPAKRWLLERFIAVAF